MCVGGGGDMNTRITIFYTQDTLSRSLLQTVKSNENIPNGIQNRGHCSLNHHGKIT